MFYWHGIKIYNSKKELYDTCLTSEKEKTIIAVEVYSEDDGEFIGYKKEYV